MACKCNSDEVRQAKFHAALKQMDKILGNMEGVLTRLDNKLAKMMYVNPACLVAAKCKKQKRQSNGRFA